MKPTAKQLQNAFFRGNFSRFDIINPNTFLNYMEGEMDLVGVRKSGYVDEIEIKLSVQDFKADFKKVVHFKLPEEERKIFGPWSEEVNKHEALQAGRLAPNRFSFYVPKDLADKIEIPEYAGLYIFDGRFAREIKSPKLLHKRKIDDHKIIQLGRKMAYRYWQLMMKEDMKEKL